MKRFILLVIVAIALSLLYACGHMELMYQDAPAVSASENTEPPASESPQDTSAAPASPQVASGPESAGADPSAPPPVSETPSEQESSTVSPGEPAPGGQSVASPAADASPAPDSSAVGAPEPSPDAVASQPPLLTQIVSEAGLSFDTFGFSQLMLVVADTSGADIYCYDKGDSGLWELNESIGYVGGYAGRNGVSTDKHEGDGCSPGGLFSLEYAFGNNPKPPTGMEYRDITKDSYWIVDPDSEYYNQWVEGAEAADWTGAEHLSVNIVSYAYAVVIGYNTPPGTVSGKGSAIFLHIGNKPTSGCVAVTQDTLLKILEWLSADKNPSILIAAK